MVSYPFPHDGPVYVVGDEAQEIAYYSLNDQKYKRVRLCGIQNWLETKHIPIDDDHFFMVIACLQVERTHRNGLLGVG